MARPSLAARASIVALLLGGLSLAGVSTLAPGCGGGHGGGGSAGGPTPVAGSVPYSIAYVRQPRYGDDADTIWPEVFHPARFEPGADLMLLHPDGSEKVLVAGGNGSVTDPMVSFDGQWIYYALVHDLRPQSLNGQRGDLPTSGSDIYRIRVATRAVEQLTHGEFTPNTGAGTWDETNPVDPAGNVNRLGYGILNLGPCPLAGGKVAFTSNRNGFEPPKGYTNPTFQLFVMDEDGGNVVPIAPMSIGSALHPTPLADGRLMFTSYESQGLRDQRMWGIWSIQPDGRAWAPVVSAFHGGQAFHFMTQRSDGEIVVVDYYSRRSLLAWKVFGERLDGWTNADHPTESVPGDASTLPAGADVNAADLDYTGTAMPPPGSGVPLLTEDEKRTIARWIDLGCPIDLDAPGTSPARGKFCDDQRPCLTVSSPRPGSNPAPLSLLRVGAADANSGIAAGSLSIKADVAIAGRAAGAELSDLAQATGDGIWTIALAQPLARGTRSTLEASVRDVQGNATRVAVRFSVERPRASRGEDGPRGGAPPRGSCGVSRP